MALLAVMVVAEDHYAQYRDPAESTTPSAEPSTVAREYEDIAEGRNNNDIYKMTLRERRQYFPTPTAEQQQDANDIKNAVQQIMSGRYIDEIEANPTSPTRSVSWLLSDTPLALALAKTAHVGQDNNADTISKNDWMLTTTDNTVDNTITTHDAVIAGRQPSTVDQWTTTAEEDGHELTGPPQSRSTFFSIETEEAAGDVIVEEDAGFTEVYFSKNPTAPALNVMPLTPNRTSSVTRTTTSTTTQRPTNTQIVVTGATPLAAQASDSVQYYSDEEPGPAPGAVAALEPPHPQAADEAARQRRPPAAISTTTPRRFFDIPIFLEIINNLTRYVETNITQEVNETLLQRWSVGPTCPLANTSSTTPHSTTAHIDTDYSANMTGTVMGKCFVCGLRVLGVPMHAQCADAFAGDFLPLVPVDPTARGRISEFRKYCRFMDVPRWHYNSSDPRSLWGRWTGGCSVRWVDLTGIYTQRSCRNRHRAVVGRHFGSKRMAKLEMALQHTDNGCIISPVASLLPLSRGVNLYARFHACVCTGNWCNAVNRCVGSWRTLLVVLWTLLASTLTSPIS